MRTRALACAAIALTWGALAACGDDGGPTGPSNVLGQYALQTVNGDPLPFEVREPPGAEILLGGVELRQGSDYELVLEYRDKVGTSTYEESGAWSLFATDSIFFRPDGATPAYRGRLASGVLTAVAPDGLLLRFAR